jgi:hypothetical protein
VAVVDKSVGDDRFAELLIEENFMLRVLRVMKGTEYSTSTFLMRRLLSHHAITSLSATATAVSQTESTAMAAQIDEQSADKLWHSAAHYARTGNFSLFVSAYTRWKQSPKEGGYYENNKHGLLASAGEHKEIVSYLRRDGAYRLRSLYEVGYCLEDESEYVPEVKSTARPNLKKI